MMNNTQRKRRIYYAKKEIENIWALISCDDVTQFSVEALNRKIEALKTEISHHWISLKKNRGNGDV